MPNSLENTEGNSAGNDPFDGLLTPSRYQQVFAASEFSTIQNGGGFVILIVFRPNAGCRGIVGQSISNFQVNLSTTSRGPDSLSTLFAENVGSDETTVVGPGAFSISGGCSQTMTPQLFDMYIEPTVPFLYDPRAGNLLMELRNYSGSTSDGNLLLIDGQDGPGDSISSIFGYGVTNAAANFVSTFGYIVKFYFRPVPVLSISWLTDSVLLRWDNDPYGFTPEQSGTVGPGANWQPTGGTVIDNQGFKEVTLPFDTQTPARFFRLVLPSLPSARPSTTKTTGSSMDQHSPTVKPT